MKKIFLIIVFFVIANGDGFSRDNINFLNLVYQLNISNSQKVKIQNIITTCRNKPLKRPQFFSEAFQNGVFDEMKYVSIKTKFIENRIKKQAYIISKILKVLNKQQKMKLEGFFNGRNFDDRR